MNNSVGRAAVKRFGKRTALGTDGIDGDMFAESRTAYFRAREDDIEASADDYVALLGRGTALASEHFSQPVGTLDPGAAADLMVLNYDPPTPLTAENVAWHWMFALTRANVESVMIGGEWVVRDRECCTVDEERVRHETRREAKRLWERMENI